MLLNFSILAYAELDLTILLVMRNALSQPANIFGHDLTNLENHMEFDLLQKELLHILSFFDKFHERRFIHLPRLRILTI